MTNRDKVLAALRHASRSLNDDELARRTEIRPRQTVNQICRHLAAEGLITRVSGPDGKIVNQFCEGHAADPLSSTTTGAPPAQVAALRAAGEHAADGHNSLPAGDSSEQRLAERAMLDALEGRLGLSLHPRRIDRAGDTRVEIDGADDALTVLVECFAHQGPAKGAQKYKLINDAVKLHWVSQGMVPPPRKILCVSDAAAVAHLRGRSWQGQALRDFGIEIEVVTLPLEIRAAVASAQTRQFR